MSLSELLTDPEVGRVPASDVTVLVDEDATRLNILLHLNRIAKQAQPDDLVIFYFSGHGYHSGRAEDSAYLIPHDAMMEDPETTCIDFHALSQKINAMPARKVVTVIDACHAGGVKAASAKGIETPVVPRYLREFERAEGRPFLLSSDEAEVSWELPSLENSVFTHFLIRGLRGEADSSNDGMVTFTEVADFVEREVAAYTTEHFPTPQRPTRRYGQSQIRGDIPLSFNATRLAEARQERQLADYQLRMGSLGEQIGSEADALRPGEVERLVTFAVHTKEKELRDEFLPDRRKRALLLIEGLADQTISASFYRSQVARIYPSGLPADAAQNTEEEGTGIIHVNSSPPGAAVYLDDRFVGYTPRILKNVPSGRHVLRITREGENPVEHVVAVAENAVAKAYHKW